MRSSETRGFQPFDTGFTQGLGVGHDMGLAHLDEVFSVKKLPHLELLLDGEPAWLAQITGKHHFLGVGQAHWEYMSVEEMPANWEGSAFMV